MANEVVIIVRAKNDTKAVFDLIRKDARDLGDNMAVDVTAKFTERLNREAANTGGNIARAGDAIGDTIGARVAQRVAERVSVDVNNRLRDSAGSSTSDRGRTTINNNTTNRDRTTINNGGGSGGNDRDRVHVSVDVDKKNILQRVGDLGQGIAEKIRGGLSQGFASFFSGDLVSIVVKALGGGALAVALAGPLGAAISSSILVALGGGAIGIGIAAAIKSSPTIKDAITSLKKDAAGAFSGFGDYFKGPVADFLSMAGGLLDDLRPSIDSLGKVLAPVADSLAHGVIGFLQNALPGIERAMEASEPLIKTLADNLPGIGDAMGRFFDHISKGAPSANEFFNDLLNILPYVIRTIGILIEAFTNLYGMFRYTFFAMLDIAATWAVGITSAARIAFGWVPGLGPKLDTAAHKAAEFKEKVNEQLHGINDVDVAVRIRTFGLNTALAVLDTTRQLRAIGAIGHAAGGITGAAAGGIRNGLTWVGEHGPELVNVPAGSRVHSNPDSMRMAGQGGGGMGAMVVQLVMDGRILAERLIDPQREIVDRRFGGNVQNAYGRP